MPHRSIGLALPTCDADQLDALCESLGREKAPILRQLLYDFMAQHGVTPASTQPHQQEEKLPMTG